MSALFSCTLCAARSEVADLDEHNLCPGCQTLMPPSSESIASAVKESLTETAVEVGLFVARRRGL